MARCVKIGSELRVLNFLIWLLIVMVCASAASVEQVNLLSTPHFLRGAIRVIPSVKPGLLVLYADSLLSLTDDSIVNSFSLGPLEKAYFSPSGSYFAIAKKEVAFDLRCDLTLYNFDGKTAWSTEDVPSGAILISDDGRTVVGVNGYSILGSEFLITFFDSKGKPVNSLKNVRVEPEHTRLSPDGSTFVTVIRGDRTDGIVSLDDRLVAYSDRGEFLWEQVGYGLHFSGQLVVRNQRVFASFYADGGQKQYIHIYDTKGNQIAQVNPRIPNYGAYHLRISPTGDYLIGFGHHHIVLIETKKGEILWEWEWNDVSEQEFIHDCLVANEGSSTIAVAYAGKLGRILLVFDNTGKLIRQHQYTVESSNLGDLRLVPAGNEVLLIDNGSGENLRFSR